LAAGDRPAEQNSPAREREQSGGDRAGGSSGAGSGEREHREGAELSPGLGPERGSAREALFVKEVFGSFSGTGLEAWLHEVGAEAVLVVGFYAHMCVSTTAREALMRGLDVSVDPRATGACALEHDVLGRLSAEEVLRAALLHLTHMGASVFAEAEAGTAARR